MTSYRTPLSRARGLGSAKHGVGHWITERITSIALIPLTLWAVWAVLQLARADYETARAFVAQPMNAILLALTLVVGLWHMMLGMRVVVEDYIHKPLGKAALLILNLFVCVLAGAAGLFSILKVALGAGL